MGLGSAGVACKGRPDWPGNDGMDPKQSFRYPIKDVRTQSAFPALLQHQVKSAAIPRCTSAQDRRLPGPRSRPSVRQGCGERDVVKGGWAGS